MTQPSYRLGLLENLAPGGFGMRYKGIPRRFKEASHHDDARGVALFAEKLELEPINLLLENKDMFAQFLDGLLIFAQAWKPMQL
jgi:hypothetical protein